MPGRSSPNTASTCPKPSPGRWTIPTTNSPKPGDRIFAETGYRIVARPADALAAAQVRVREAGYDCVVLGDRLQGEAREVAAEHARLARDFAATHRRMAILSGGELTVTLQRRRPRRAEPGICAGARHPSCRRQGNCGAGGRYRRHRRRPRPAGRPCRRLYRRHHPGAGRRRRPRSRRVSRRQRFHGVFQRHRRFVHARPDVHQRHRLPRHRR